MAEHYYTDLCAFKRFLRKKGVLFAYKKELKKRYAQPFKNNFRPWSTIIVKLSKCSPTGLYDAINETLEWARVETIHNCASLNHEWNEYWLSNCGPKYYKRYGDKIGMNIKRALEKRRLI